MASSEILRKDCLDRGERYHFLKKKLPDNAKTIIR